MSVPGRTILIVDDEPQFLEMLSLLLREAGYRVLEARDGEEAWGRLDGGGADMAIVDFNLPGMDGAVLTQRIRSDSRFSNMPILMLTVRDLVEDQIHGFDRGADDYVTKPFDSKMLLARLRVFERRLG